ncbi:MAG: sigma-54 dependent transcriptional regulator [Bacteroidales bacterium]|jgi:transcriptional regulator with PAS, ATPase and Fis domain|nr:sigma-54 dependent transcriptional regulator [Bacteroidales bacterium]
MNVQDIKRRFEIIGHAPELDRAIEIAMQVAPTSLSVLITGESGAGKEVFPKIIHQLSTRKHGQYIAVNCGAIPEGTIDSELFGHEKGSFTGAHEARKGYFEVADGGTIFLDEVAELPLSTQVRLLRVLESGEFLKVGSSKVQKTNVRVVAATNVNVPEAVQMGKFRQDLYYRLNTVPIHVPSLRERKEDIPLLFRKFAIDFSEKYRMPAVKLDEKAQLMLKNYSWTGNIRQLKNITEQISILEQERLITAETLKKYLPPTPSRELPVLYSGKGDDMPGVSERDLLYKVLFDMRKDITDLKRVVAELASENQQLAGKEPVSRAIQAIPENQEFVIIPSTDYETDDALQFDDAAFLAESETIEEPLLLKNREKELIEKALKRHNGKRKPAAKELGVSERTLYRKIKEYDIKE